jgi:hypothetical protein
LPLFVLAATVVVSLFVLAVILSVAKDPEESDATQNRANLSTTALLTSPIQNVISTEAAHVFCEQRSGKTPEFRRCLFLVCHP